MTSETPSAAAPPNHLAKRRRIAVAIACSIFGLCGLVYLIYWVGWGRFSEWTDDAYVNGNMVMLTPQVQGIVTTILSDNTQLVEQGQPIVIIDKHDYEIALEKARADLGKSVRDTIQLFVKVGELESALDARKADLIRAKLDYEHRNALLASGSVSKEDFEHSETTLFASFGRMMETQAMLEAAYAQVQGTTVPTHPKVMQAKAMLKRAFLDLHRCTVLSPVKGIVTQRKIQVGQYVKSQDPLLAIVPLDQIWVDANYREMQLENLRIGQPVLLRAEMYGRDFDFHGKIVGLNPGTGSVFSVLPPQNATGNWIKIIQRIPVKISLDAEELQVAPLVLGLTMTVWTDTHSREGKRLPTDAPMAPLYQTAIYEEELAGVDQLIESIIASNMMKQEVIGDER